jgi:hypothetical protein
VKSLESPSADGARRRASESQRHGG